MGHAENLHLGASVLGTSLANAIIANDQLRREKAAQAAADAASVQSVRRLAAMLAQAQKENAALRAKEAALQAEVVSLQYDLTCAHAALRRVV